MDKENAEVKDIKWGRFVLGLLLLIIVLKVGVPFYKVNIRDGNCGWGDIPKVFYNIYYGNKKMTCFEDNETTKILKAIQK